jgi:hypothetical protein
LEEPHDPIPVRFQDGRATPPAQICRGLQIDLDARCFASHHGAEKLSLRAVPLRGYAEDAHAIAVLQKALCRREDAYAVRWLRQREDHEIVA